MLSLNRCLWRRVLVLLLWIGCAGVPAIPAPAESAPDPEFRLFEKAQLAVQVVGGAFKGPIFVKTQRPAFHIYQVNFRIGWMLSDPVDPRFFFRGNFELLPEFTYSDVNGNIDGYFAGGGLLLRYNILSIQPRRLIPYMHGGAGIVRNNIYKDRTQRMIGHPTEFTLRGGVGIRFLIGDRWSLDMEGAIEHISNAGLAERNRGMNAAGFLMGITRFF